MRKVISVLALSLALTCSASAGDIQNGVTGTPPQQPATAVQDQPTGGEIQNPQTTDGEIQNGAAATFAELVLTLLALS